nr:exopolysaccharide biosynthesis protein [Aurantimonas sp. CSK15Z-1]
MRALSVSRRPGIPVEDFSEAFGSRAFGAFLILFGGINAIPLPPGVPVVLGSGLMLVAFQMAIGRRRLWLPNRVRRLSLSPQTLRRLMERLGGPLRRVERLARPRYWPTADFVAPAIGWMALILSFLVMLPFPFTNMIPGLAIALFGVAVTARDGLWLLAAILLGLGAVIFLAILYGGAVLALLAVLG